MLSLQYFWTELTTPTMRQSSRWFASLPVLHVEDRSLDGAEDEVSVPSETGSVPPPPVTLTPSRASTSTTMIVPAPPPTAIPRPPPMPRRSWTWPVSSRAPGRHFMRGCCPDPAAPTRGRSGDAHGRREPRHERGGVARVDARAVVVVE